MKTGKWKAKYFLKPANTSEQLPNCTPLRMLMNEMLCSRLSRSYANLISMETTGTTPAATQSPTLPVEITQPQPVASQTSTSASAASPTAKIAAASPTANPVTTPTAGPAPAFSAAPTAPATTGGQ